MYHTLIIGCSANFYEVTLMDVFHNKWRNLKTHNRQRPLCDISLSNPPGLVQRSHCHARIWAGWSSRWNRWARPENGWVLSFKWELSQVYLNCCRLWYLLPITAGLCCVFLVMEGKVSFKLNVQPEIAPGVQVVAYAVLPSENVIAHKVDFSVEKCFSHKVRKYEAPTEVIGC